MDVVECRCMKGWYWNERVKNKNILKEFIIRNKLLGGILLVSVVSGCASLRDSLTLGAGTGAVIGAIAGHQRDGDKSDKAVKGAVFGGVTFGLASYFIHNSLEKRDSRVRRDTLLNLEHYEVMGFEDAGSYKSKGAGDKCFVTKTVDGALVSIPCSLADDSE